MTLCLNINNTQLESDYVFPVVQEMLIRLFDTNNPTNPNSLMLVNKKFFNDAELIGSGKFSKVYLKKNKIIKISKIPEKINSLLFGKKICNHIAQKYLDEFFNEIHQTITYSRLNRIFPNNIIKISKATLAIVPNNKFPINIFEMNHIVGIPMCKFIEICIAEDFDKILSTCLKVLFFSNTIGFFHNDINLTNILITKNLNPVFIDYSFSKNINKINKFPIECMFLISELKKVIRQNLHTDYFNLMYLMMSNFFTKYEIFNTEFIEKILTGSGIFSRLDYKNLKIISSFDLIELRTQINNLNK